MKNITLSVDDQLLEEARRYAQERGMSLNAMIRQMLDRQVRKSSARWLEECFELMDQARPKGKDIRWKREELYDE